MEMTVVTKHTWVSVYQDKKWHLWFLSYISVSHCFFSTSLSRDVMVITCINTRITNALCTVNFNEARQVMFYFLFLLRMIKNMVSSAAFKGIQLHRPDICGLVQALLLKSDCGIDVILNAIE